MVNRLRPTLPLLASLLWCAGCPGDDTDDVPPMDGGDVDSPTAVGFLEIGSGGIGVYEPLNDGDTALLAEGCQGGQHVWVGLRLTELDPARTLIRMQMERASDGYLASIPFQVRLTFEEVPGETYRQLTGLRLQVPDPDDVLGQEVIIRARVEENGGNAMVESDKRVFVEWGDEVCGGTRQRDAGLPDGGTDGGS